MSKVYYLTFGTSGDPRTFFGLAPTFLIFSNNGSAVTPPSISSVSGATGFYSFTWGTTTPICFMADAATTSPGTGGRYVIGSIDPVDRGDEYAATMIAIGTTLSGYGRSNLALGTTAVALGTTSVAIGTSHISQGVSLFALGTTSVAWGANIAGSLTAQGASLTSIGNSLTAFESSSNTNFSNLGTTLVGIGITQLTTFSYLGSTASSMGSTSIDPTTIFGFLMRAQEFREGNSVYTKATGVLDFYSRGSSTLLREKTIADSTTQTTKT